MAVAVATTGCGRQYGCGCDNQVRLRPPGAVATARCGCDHQVRLRLRMPLRLRLRQPAAVATTSCGCDNQLRLRQPAAVATTSCGCPGGYRYGCGCDDRDGCDDR